MIECHHHDRKWLDSVIRNLPPGMRQDARDKYSKRYLQVVDDDDHTSVGRARSECNTRLRHYVSKFTGCSLTSLEP